MRYFEKLSGKRIFLSPMNPGDAEFYTRWLNDPAVAVGFGMYRWMVSLPRERKHTEALPDDDHEFAIVLRKGGESPSDDRLIGYICLLEPNHIDCSAKLSVFIGEEADRGKGYGAEAMRLLLDYGFHTLHLHNIQLHLNSDNARALACYKKAGFKEFGRRRESKFHSGRYVDEIYMDILDSEFAAN